MSAIEVQAKCAIFDMDGTLIDTTRAITDHWEEYASKHGLDANEIMKMSHGRPMLETMKHWTPEHATPEISAKYERRLALNANGVALAAGSAKLIESIPRDRFGMFTGAKTFTAEQRLSQCEIEKPASFVTADMISRGKPDPEGWVLAAKNLGYEAKDCVAFEDSTVGVQAAKAAGMYTVACLSTNTFNNLKAAGADYIVKDLSEVNAEIIESGNLKITISSSVM
ncbi:hypothetical protein INT43_002793 [Umbelopsis isabellina]|uniref:Uncharacterized protein n=1 Tax=Mortierella isabellina TaxID=91625 RepID=A0A8H7Q6B4_MORIS|nr:hypothetical protein INT43_002793 [Umbelopsis isabellina]